LTLKLLYIITRYTYISTADHVSHIPSPFAIQIDINNGPTGKWLRS